MFLISPELHLKLAYIYFVSLSFSHVDAAEEKGLVLLQKWDTMRMRVVVNGCICKEVEVQQSMLQR